MKNLLFIVLFSVGLFINNHNIELKLQYNKYDLEVSNINDDVDIHLYNVISIHVFFNHATDYQVNEVEIFDLYTRNFNELPPGFVSPLILSTRLITLESSEEILTLNLTGEITRNKESLDLVSETYKNKLGYKKVVYLQDGNDFYTK